MSDSHFNHIISLLCGNNTRAIGSTHTHAYSRAYRLAKAHTSAVANPSPALSSEPANTALTVEDECYIFEVADEILEYSFGFQYGIPWSYFDRNLIVPFKIDSFWLLAQPPNGVISALSRYPKLISETGKTFIPLIQLDVKFSPPDARTTYDKLQKSTISETEKYFAERAWESKCKRLFAIYLIDEAIIWWHENNGLTVSSLTRSDNTSVLGTKNEIVYVLVVDEASTDGMTEEELKLYNEILEWLPTMLEKIQVL